MATATAPDLYPYLMKPGTVYTFYWAIAETDAASLYKGADALANMLQGAIVGNVSINPTGQSEYHGRGMIIVSVGDVTQSAGSLGDLLNAGQSLLRDSGLTPVVIDYQVNGGLTAQTPFPSESPAWAWRIIVANEWVKTHMNPFGIVSSPTGAVDNIENQIGSAVKSVAGVADQTARIVASVAVLGGVVVLAFVALYGFKLLRERG